MPTLIRNFRIADSIYKPAATQAKKLGIPVSLVVKQALRNFAANPQVVIGEPEEIKNVSSEIHKKSQELVQAVKLFKSKSKKNSPLANHSPHNRQERTSATRRAVSV